jgi:hypothetical protein
MYAMDGGQIAWLVTTVLVAVSLIALNARMEKASRAEIEKEDDDGN